jgi:hypothetical protein
VGVGEVTSLLAVLNRDWTHVNIHIMDVMWFVQLTPIIFCSVQTEDTIKIVPIATMSGGYTMDLPADQYTAQ